MPPSAAASPRSCAGCSAALGGAPRPAWGPKRNPAPLPAPSWPRTLPPEKPGGAFLPEAPGFTGERRARWELALDCEGPRRSAPWHGVRRGQQRACLGDGGPWSPGGGQGGEARRPSFLHLLSSSLTLFLIKVSAHFPPSESPWIGLTVGVKVAWKDVLRPPPHTHTHAGLWSPRCR